MKKIHVILLYTKRVVQPENTSIYSFLEENSFSGKNKIDIKFSEIFNEHEQPLEIVFKHEAFNYDSLDYLIGVDLDYLFVPASKIKELILSFISDNINVLDFPFLKGIKRPVFLNKKKNIVCDNIKFDAFELLNARDISSENIFKLKSLLFDNRILFVDFYIQSDRTPIFIKVDKPRIFSSVRVDYLSVGGDNPIYSFLDYEKKISILDEVLKLNKSYILFYIRFLYIGFDKKSQDMFEVKMEDAPCSIFDNNNDSLCLFGTKSDIYHYLKCDKEVKFFLRKK